MKKRFLPMLFCLALLLMLLPADAKADMSGTCGDNLTWTFTRVYNRLTITGSGDMNDYSWWDDVPWFNVNYMIKAVSLPSGLTSIGDYAFNCCSSLTSVTIPNSVTSIGEEAFIGCTGLTSVTIPNRVTSIGDGAFSGCTGLTSVTIPNSVTSIGGHVFDGCTGLTSITIPNSVTSIGEHAFDDSGLTSITIPNGVTSIGEYAFYDCTGLESVTIPNSVTSIGSWAFCCCTGLKSVTIPNGVTSIREHTFQRCTELTSITIPNSVTSIESYAFDHCTGLRSITIPNGVTSIGDYAFCDSWLTSVTIPNSVTNIGKAAFDCPFLRDVYYAGTAEQRAQIRIYMYNVSNNSYDDGNDPLLDATWHYTNNMFTIILNANGGSCSKSSITVTYGNTYGTLPTPARTGYDFKGWWTTKDSGGKQVTASTVCYATGNYTMYARWEPKKYTVTLNPNGGTCGTSTKTVTYGQAYGTLPVPKRLGYTFAGWWTVKDAGGKKVTASTICYASGNYTLYARWTEGYTMTFDPNGGTVSPTTKVVQYGQPYGTLPTPTKAGYTFTGWWTTKADGGKKVVPTTVCYASAGYTLYARWTAKKFVVTLNPNGGECATATKTVTYGQAYGTMPVPSPRTGYTFAGWYTAKTGGKKVTATTICYATGNYTVYARWTPKTYTVTFNPNGGSYTKSSMTVTYGKQYGALPEPTRTGYSFAGWWTKKDSGGKQVFSSTVCYATGNYTLYARWTQD